MFLLHPFSLSDLRERVNFKELSLYMLDVIPVFLYNKTKEPNKILIER